MFPEFGVKDPSFKVLYKTLIQNFDVHGVNF